MGRKAASGPEDVVVVVDDVHDEDNEWQDGGESFARLFSLPKIILCASGTSAVKSSMH